MRYLDLGQVGPKTGALRSFDDLDFRGCATVSMVERSGVGASDSIVGGLGVNLKIPFRWCDRHVWARPVRGGGIDGCSPLIADPEQIAAMGPAKVVTPFNSLYSLHCR